MLSFTCYPAHCKFHTKNDFVLEAIITNNIYCNLALFGRRKNLYNITMNPNLVMIKHGYSIRYKRVTSCSLCQIFLILSCQKIVMKVRTIVNFMISIHVVFMPHPNSHMKIKPWFYHHFVLMIFMLSLHLAQDWQEVFLPVPQCTWDGAILQCSGMGKTWASAKSQAKKKPRGGHNWSKEGDACMFMWWDETVYKPVHWKSTWICIIYFYLFFSIVELQKNY